MQEDKENCLIMIGKQNIKLKGGSIGFKNHFKQLAVAFKIYADFECKAKEVQSSGKNNSLYTEKYQDHIPCSFTYKVVCIDNKFSKPVVLYRRKNAIYRFIEAILEEKNYCKKIIKKHFNKNVVMPAEDKCDKLFDSGDDKVRDYSQITGKYRGSAH